MKTYVGKIPPWLALLFSMLFAFEVFNPSSHNILESSISYQGQLPTIHTVLAR